MSVLSRIKDIEDEVRGSMGRQVELRKTAGEGQALAWREEGGQIGALLARFFDKGANGAGSRVGDMIVPLAAIRARRTTTAALPLRMGSAAALAARCFAAFAAFAASSFPPRSPCSPLPLPLPFPRAALHPPRRWPRPRRTRPPWATWACSRPSWPSCGASCWSRQRAAAAAARGKVRGAGDRWGRWVGSDWIGCGKTYVVAALSIAGSLRWRGRGGERGVRCVVRPTNPAPPLTSPAPSPAPSSPPGFDVNKVGDARVGFVGEWEPAYEMHRGIESRVSAQLSRSAASACQHPNPPHLPTASPHHHQKNPPGFPSVGKSTLLTKLTGTFSEAASYEFTTLTCVPGIVRYRGASLDGLPGI
jgi:hypothetical protein